MVTIEQKILLFSKLLQQYMGNEFTTKIENIKKQYEDEIEKDKYKVDQEAESIVEKSRKKGEEEELEMTSKGNIAIKKAKMTIREKCFVIFMGSLKSAIKDFTDKEDYKTYLASLIKQFIGGDKLSPTITVCMTAKDLKKYGEYVVEEIKKSTNIYKNISLKTGSNDLIGGFTVEDTEKDIRINMSVQAVLEDNKDYIMQTLFESIGEDSDTHGK